ncbi:MAG: 3-phosphoshikimate 1-carboxyvinyltransferase [Proteobacteria bacterium]|nr:3-phosphoshikimate 1-carboxyvinyltransferase [Pseudomonadota bacterium]MDA1356741.1 3-phosphoshikimate 1-carboxyvinyltransferase [Pseudomonadota bacterium]
MLDQPAAPQKNAAGEALSGPRPVISEPSGPLSGEAVLPGDKSISHRALIVGALAVGETRVQGLLEGGDVLATARALGEFGVDIERDNAGTWRIWGVGVGGFQEPARQLDLGNAGTAVRLLMGVAAQHPFTSFFSGDESLHARPMGRVAEPLTLMGVRITARSGCRLPLALTGSTELLPIGYTLPVASAQVKSAILLAGLAAPGETSIVEPAPTRDHSERMLRHFGAELRVEEVASGGRKITLSGQPELSAQTLSVPADLSSAAFPLAASLIVPGSDVLLRNVGINPLRSGLLDCVREMGGTIELRNSSEVSGEPVADIMVRASKLHGIDVPAARAPSMIDEYPILAVLAACAKGPSRLCGLDELRHKESDRFAAIVAGLSAAGCAVTVEQDDILISGAGAPPPGGAKVVTSLDHRIAMAFLVLGMACRDGMTIDDGAPIATSFPGFVELMNGLGGGIRHG